MTNDPTLLAQPRPSPWRPVAEMPDHLLCTIDGAEVGNGVQLAVEVGSKNSVGSDYFRASLQAEGVGRTAPFLWGLFNRGPFPGYNWVEVTGSLERVPLDSGDEVQIPEGIDLHVLTTLGTLVPAGGHLMVEYDAAHRATTAQALAANVPPVATPVGAMMFAAGCGVAFKDWYLAEGGREGARKLQGFRAVDAAHEERRGREMFAELEAFMSRIRDVDWDIQAAVRPLAEAAITVLRDRLAVPDGPMALPTV